MEEFEALDEYPDLSRFLRFIADERRLYSAALFGTVPEEWQQMLQQAGVYARRAAQEVAASNGSFDDIIKPVWNEDGRDLLGAQRMSGDAYLDLLQLQGEHVNPEAYEDPPVLGREGNDG